MYFFLWLCEILKISRLRSMTVLLRRLLPKTATSQQIALWWPAPIFRTIHEMDFREKKLLKGKLRWGKPFYSLLWREGSFYSWFWGFSFHISVLGTHATPWRTYSSRRELSLYLFEYAYMSDTSHSIWYLKLICFEFKKYGYFLDTLCYTSKLCEIEIGIFVPQNKRIQV